MKICYITSVFPRFEGDPTASFLVELIRRLKERGVEILVFCPSFHGLKDQNIFTIQVRRFRYFFKRYEDLTHDQGAPNKIRKPIYLFISFFYVVCGLIHMIRFCRREKFDVLHVHWPFPHGIWGYFGAKMNRSRVVSSFHGAELLLVDRFPFVKYFLRHAIRHSDRITSNSSFTKAKITGIEHVEVEVLGYGTTIRERKVEREPRRKKQILFVGRLIERKGVEYLIRAMPAVISRVDSELIIVGDGDQKTRLERWVKENHLEESIIFRGVVSNEELNRHYQECDLFVLPAIVDSRGDTEGLGVVLIEALTYKKPVIASRVGGIVDVIRHGESGILVPEKDSKALASSIIEVLSDDQLAARLGEDGFSFVKERFGWDGIVSRILGIYQDVLK